MFKRAPQQRSVTGFTRNRLSIAVGQACLVLSLGALYHSDTYAAEPAAVESVVRQYAISAESLNSGLTQFAQEAGVTVSYVAEQVEGKTTAGLSGSFSTTRGLQQLLQGSGLEARYQGNRIYVLRAASSQSQSEATLPVVTVQSKPESAMGPTTGYIARRTSAATKTDTAYRETPQAISVVTREQMSDQGVQSLAEAMQYVSGVRTDGGGAQTSANNLFVRGFNSQGKTYLDGLRVQPDGYFGFFAEEPYGLERVEVFKGPTSVLYGQSGVPGGMVAMVSKRPTEEKRGETEFSVGTNNRIQGAVDVSGPLTEDGTFLYRVVGLVRDADAVVDFQKDDRVFVAPSLTWKPNASTSLTLLATYQKNKALYTTNVPYAATDGTNPHGRVPMSRFFGEPGFDFETTEYKSIGYEFSYDFNDNWRFRQNFRYSDLDNHENYLLRSSGLIGGTTINRQYSLRHAYGTNNVLDQHLQGRFNTGAISHTLLVGLDIAKSSSKRVEQMGNASSFNIYNPVYGSAVDTSVFTSFVDTEQRSLQKGIYLQDQIRWDKWVGTFSVRHDDVTSKVTNRINGAVTSDRNWNATTRRAGINYLFDNGITPYASYSESFNPATGTTSPARGGRSFEPERGKQYEVGVKYQPAESAISSTLSVFDLRRQNVRTIDPDNILFSVQTGEVQSKGVELEVAGELTKNLKVAAAYSYVNIETSKDNTPSNVGKRPVRAPAHLASAWMDYSFRSGSLDGLGLGLGVRYTGSSWGDAANSFKVPSYTLLDFALRYDLEKLSSSLHGWSASLNIRNLTDKYYVASCFLTTACNFGEGRSAIAKVTYKW
jgi:iron complex outermembrane receptor protein